MKTGFNFCSELLFKISKKSPCTLTALFSLIQEEKTSNNLKRISLSLVLTFPTKCTFFFTSNSDMSAMVKIGSRGQLSFSSEASSAELNSLNPLSTSRPFPNSGNYVVCHKSLKPQDLTPYISQHNSTIYQKLSFLK